MASKVSVVVTDDLDGSEGAHTVRFGLDGVNYEIDLAEKNIARLEKAMAPYVQVARRVVRRANRSGTRSSAVRADRAEVRAWAKGQGLAVSDRGRISADVMQQYESAH
jgi:Lsr2